MNSSLTNPPASSFALIILGRSGSGKTSLALNFPKPYVLDCDNNLAGPTRFHAEKEVYYDTVNVLDDGTPVKLRDRYKRAADLLTAAAKSDSISTIIVDSCTTFHEYIMSEVRRQASITTAMNKGANIADGENLRQQDWAKVAFLWKEVVTRLRTTNKLIIFTGHTKLEKDELDGTVFQHLLLQGQMKDQLAALFSDCWLTYVESGFDTKRQPIGKYKVRVLQDNRFLDLKNTLNLPSTFSVPSTELTNAIKTLSP